MTYLDAWKKKHSISALQDRADSENDHGKYAGSLLWKGLGCFADI